MRHNFKDFYNQFSKFILSQFESYPEKVKSISNRSNWTCLICNTSFKLKKQLIEHEKSQHQVTQQNTYAYQCKVCAKSFRRPYLLREHEQVHEKKILFRCQLCPAKYRLVLFKASSWKEYVFGLMSHPTYIISLSPEVK